MKLGVASPNFAEGWLLPELAVELESRGFESLWVGEHSHIPVATKSIAPSGASPEAYAYFMSPLVALAAAVSVTSDLIVGTAVCLLLEHDLIDLATQVSTLDVMSGGRFRFGVGVGWNAEELQSHRPDIPFKKRFAAMRERVAALRAIWREGISEYHGAWDDLSPSWVNPKPQSGSVPIYMGGWASLAISHAAEYADHWLPIDEYFRDQDGAPDIEVGVSRFRHLLEEHNRDPDSVGITVMATTAPTPAMLDDCERSGVERAIVTVPPDRDGTLNALDELGALAGAR